MIEQKQPEVTEIRVATHDGHLGVVGHLRGRFAATPAMSLDLPRDGWDVTHVASGNATNQVWGTVPLTEEEAIAVAEYLDAHFPIPDDCGWGDEGIRAIRKWAQDPKNRPIIDKVREHVVDLITDKAAP